MAIWASQRRVDGQGFESVPVPTAAKLAQRGQAVAFFGDTIDEVEKMKSLLDKAGVRYVERDGGRAGKYILAGLPQYDITDLQSALGI